MLRPLCRCLRHWLNSTLAKAWDSWIAHVQWRKEKRQIMNRWKNPHMVRRPPSTHTGCALARLRQNACAPLTAVRVCVCHAQYKAFAAWVERVAWRKRMRVVLERSVGRMRNSKLAAAFYTWKVCAFEGAQRDCDAYVLRGGAWARCGGMLAERPHRPSHAACCVGAAALSSQEWVEDEKMGRHLSTKEELAVRVCGGEHRPLPLLWLDMLLSVRREARLRSQIKVKEMQEENERLRRDNERFVRLIDSGEWGRGRVAELVAAGEVLKGERDALLKLIQVRAGPRGTPGLDGGTAGL